MNPTTLVRRETLPSGAVAVTLSLLLAFGQVCSFTAQAQGRQTGSPPSLVHFRVDHTFDRLA